MNRLRLFLFLSLALSLQMLCASANAQTGLVKGVVVSSSDGLPVAGVSVIVKGTMTGTVTDANGEYSIKAAANSLLEFSFLGFKTQTVDVKDRTVLNVTLAEDSEMMEEVIVVGYGTVKKSDLTGSVASVKADEVTTASAGSVEKLLQGRVAGLTVIDSSNDSPVGGVTVRVRGISSINGSNSPLMVVDGVPMGDAGNLTSVNPAIIESIEVLKDASATAIYGSRGANGVIMITTKNGGMESNNIWFSGKVGVGMFSKKLDYWRDPVMMATLENEAYENGGSVGPYMGKVWSDGTYFPSIAQIENGIWPYYTEWKDYVFRTAVTQDYNFGIEGSKGGNRYYVSLGYYDGQGMQHNDDYSKITADLSYSNKVNDVVTITTKAGFVRGFRTNNCGTSYAYNPLWPVYNADGSYFKAHTRDFSNPVMINNELKNESDNVSGYASLKLDWKIIPDLVFSVSGNVRGSQGRSAWFNPPKYSLGGTDYNGEGGVGENTYMNITTDAFLTYTKSWGGYIPYQPCSEEVTRTESRNPPTSRVGDSPIPYSPKRLSQVQRKSSPTQEEARKSSLQGSPV